MELLGGFIFELAVIYPPPKSSFGGSVSLYLMSEGKEQLERELTRLHRERLENELEEIQSSLSTYIEETRSDTYQRRRENIYVLLAIGVIGGFFTIAPQELFQVNQTVVLGGGIFVFASLLFLFLKLNSVALADPRQENSLVSKANEFTDYLFVFSINGIIILSVANFALNYYQVELADAGQVGTLFLTFILSLLSVLRKYMKDRRRERDLHNRIRKNMVTNQYRTEIRDKFFELSRADDAEEDEIVDEVKDMVGSYAETTSQPEPIRELIDELTSISGISQDARSEITDELGDAVDKIENKNEEEKSVKELQEEKRKELEERIIQDE